SRGPDERACVDDLRGRGERREQGRHARTHARAADPPGPGKAWNPSRARGGDARVPGAADDLVAGDLGRNALVMVGEDVDAAAVADDHAADGVRPGTGGEQRPYAGGEGNVARSAEDQHVEIGRSHRVQKTSSPVGADRGEVGATALRERRQPWAAQRAVSVRPGSSYGA